MRSTHRPIWRIALALYCALAGSLPTGSWALCVESDGKMVLETACRPNSGAEVSSPADCPPEGCGECRDYALIVDVGVVGKRSSSATSLTPLALAPCSILPQASLVAPEAPPPNLHSDAPVTGRASTVVLRI